MASTRLSYHRLQKLTEGYIEEEEDEAVPVRSSRPSSWLRLRRACSNSGRRWGRPRLRIPGLRRLLRRKAQGVGAAMRVSVVKVLKRLKEGRTHLGELVTGNYMFMQVSPSPPTLASFQRSWSSLVGYRQYCNQHHHHDIVPPSTTRFNMRTAAT